MAAVSGTFNEVANPDQRNVKIEVDDETAPAFNIFDVGVEGAMLVHRATGRTMPELTWRWLSGVKGACAGGVTCFLGKVGQRNLLSVLSVPADRDEYDDPVLLREYGRFFLTRIGGNFLLRANHRVTRQISPPLAWIEGASTFFAGLANGGSGLYLDTTANGVLSAWDLEALPPEVPLGTDTGDQHGLLSEALVAAVLWDLSDDSPDEASDTVFRQFGVFRAMEYFKSSSFVDRANNGPDLVDLLDGWFCKRQDDLDGVGAITTALQFNYDYADIQPCP